MDQSSSKRAIFKTITVSMDEKKMEFLDFRTGSNISIPRERQARRDLLVRLFYEASKPLYIYSEHIQKHSIFKWIPEKLWVNTFTDQETEWIIRWAEQTWFYGIVGRLRLLMQHWALLGGYPRVQKSVEALNRALEIDQCGVRFQFFKSILREPSPQSDGWLKFCLKDFKPAVDLDAILDLSHPDNERKAFVEQIAELAEAMVQMWLATWIEKAKQGQRLAWWAVCWDLGG
jgi:hypothetical protein